MLAKKAKEKYNEFAEFFDRPVWKNRILFYASIFASIALAFTIIFGLFKLIFPDFSILSNTAYTQYNITELNNMGFYDNERYLLSALVQSLAAVIALVITLSLVAVQLAAQSYSPRVIDVYKRNPDMWILLCIYILTIFYGLGLIKIIGLSILGSYMEEAIFAAYFMGFFAFVCLIPYMLKTLDLLKPSIVIKLLALEIKKENILQTRRSEEKIAELDPLQPIIDIVHNALKRYDSETVKNGLNAIKKATIALLKANDFDAFEEWETTTHIIQHIESIGVQAADNKDVYSLQYSISALEEIGVESIKHEQTDTTNNICTALMNLEGYIIADNIRLLQFKIIGSFEKIGDEAAKQNSEYLITYISNILQVIGDDAADKNLKGITKVSIGVLRTLGLKTANKKLIYSSKALVEDLKKLLSTTNEKGWDDLSSRIETNIQTIENIRDKSKK